MRYWRGVLLAALFGFPVIALLCIQVAQYCEIKFRHAVSVGLKVHDTNGVAQAGVRFRFRESGARYLVPIPFTWYWKTKGIVHEVASDAGGLATISFREDSLYLEDISLRGHAITNFTTIFYRHDRVAFTNRGYFGIVLTAHGYYPEAKDPWRQEHTIILQ